MAGLVTYMVLYLVSSISFQRFTQRYHGFLKRTPRTSIAHQCSFYTTYLPLSPFKEHL